MTLADLKQGEKGVILALSLVNVPIKLMEMGCLPGSRVEMLQTAPFSDPLYLNINDCYLSIRRETAAQIRIEKITDGQAD